mgnify:CR=1 FL=1
MQHAGRILAVLWLVLAALSLAACTPALPQVNPAEGEMVIPALQALELGGRRLAVVATTNIIGDVVRNVGGDLIDLTVLIGPGQDPHSYQPVARDLAAVERADIVFINGLGLEEALIGEIAGVTRSPLVPVSAGIGVLERGAESAPAETQTPEPEADSHTQDPHFWMDPNNVIVWASNIADVLGTLDPANASTYTESAAAYIEQLEELDALIRERVSEIPSEDRVIVTDHLIFGYFAEEYGFKVLGTVLPGTSTTADASAGELAALVELMKSSGVRAIFMDSSAGERVQQLSERIAAETGEDIRIVPVYTGSLGALGTPADTYLGMMGTNIERISEALSGQP